MVTGISLASNLINSRIDNQAGIYNHNQALLNMMANPSAMPLGQAHELEKSMLLSKKTMETQNKIGEVLYESARKKLDKWAKAFKYT